MTRPGKLACALAAVAGAVLLTLSGCFKLADSSGADRLLLLVPDKTSFSDPAVTVWLDAAAEEGLHVQPVHDTTFLRPLWREMRGAGLILPDSVHVRMSDVLAGAVQQYVAAGGKLMLVFDAGARTPDGVFTPESRFSDLAGTHYELYRKLRGGSFAFNEVGGSIADMNALEVPPGKYYPLKAGQPRPELAVQREKASSATHSRSAAQANADPAPLEVQARLRRYEYGELGYPSFISQGDYAGRVLLRSTAGVVAGVHQYGKGQVLFVNMPLGYLAGQTDGLPLHCFLRYFAQRMLSLPYLLPVPDGIGGLVLDWHVDSNAARQPLEDLNSWLLTRSGPYSVDFTAGPDTVQFGDGLGLDILHDPAVQEIIREYERAGYEIGSHGGWIHDYFAAHVEHGDRAQMIQLLEWNRDAVAKITGKPVLEYSAPEGDQPEWVTQWLDQHGFLAYYFTGDSGMAATHEYRNGHRVAGDIWAFPILHLDRAASFEEMDQMGYSRHEVRDWLCEVSRFVSGTRQIRLIYFHPPGILPFRREIQSWMQTNERLEATRQFRWYTMVQTARFLSARENVRWRAWNQGGEWRLEASHPQTLAHQSWWFPAARFGQPRVTEGIVAISKQPGGWLAVAGNCKRIALAFAQENP